MGIWTHQKPRNNLQNDQTLLCHINDDVQYKAIIAYMVQGWIREVDRSFARASCGERLGESYT
jgi:hypothetical protein